MKYKKLLMLTTVLLFICVAVICSVTIFRITYVEVECEKVSGSNENILQFANDKLEYLENKVLPFVSVKEIENKLNSNPYVKIMEIKKSYPNKLYVKVQERQESFAVFDGTDYYMFDEDFTVVRKSDSLSGNIDGKYNVQFIFEQSYEFSGSRLNVGDKLEIYDKEIDGALSNITLALKEARKDLVSVYISSMKKQISFTFAEGYNVTVDSAHIDLSGKFNAVYDCYKLPTTDKSANNLYLVKTSSGYEVKL